MLDALDAISWDSFPQPEWNTPGEIPKAIRALASARTETEGSAAYDRILFAVGNNHRGSYYPVVLRVIPFLQEILEQSSDAARNWTLEVLMDLLTFGPESGHETVTVDASTADLAQLVDGELARVGDVAERLARSATPGIASSAHTFFCMTRAPRRR